MKDTVDDNDLLHQDELEHEGLEDDVDEADLVERSELEEETEEFEEGDLEVVLTPFEPEEDAEGDDVEATLDEILRDRFEGEEESAEDEPEARAVAASAEELRPRGADEFVCQLCFLVKHRTQLADPGQSLCRDCANNART
ncbi:MAG: DUF4193 family protein [Ilumatobacteraceae bacterium]